MHLNYKKVLLTSSIIIIIISLVKVIIDSNSLMIKEIEISVEKNGQSGSKIAFDIVQVSDLHLNNENKRNKRLVEKINSLKPDVICITGDIIDYPVKSIEKVKKCINMLNSLEAAWGIYAILGNTDLPNKDTISYFLKNSKIKLLNNEMDSITAGGQKIDILGLFYINNNDAAYKEIIEKPLNRNTIILSHAPDIVYKLNNADGRIILVLSGHTHAGQIRIPGIGAVLLPGKCEDDGYHFYDLPGKSIYKDIQYGYKMVNNISLNVSSGLNISSPRFFSANELIKITIRVN